MVSAFRSQGPAQDAQQREHVCPFVPPVPLGKSRFLPRLEQGIRQRGLLALDTVHLRAYARAAHELLDELIMRVHV